MKIAKRTLAIVLASLLALGTFAIGAGAWSMEAEAAFMSAYGLVVASAYLDDGALKDAYSTADFNAAADPHFTAILNVLNDESTMEEHWNEHGNWDALLAQPLADIEAVLLEMLTEQGYEDYHTVADYMRLKNVDYTIEKNALSVGAKKSFNHAEDYALYGTNPPINMTEAQLQAFTEAYNTNEAAADAFGEESGLTLREMAEAVKQADEAWGEMIRIANEAALVYVVYLNKNDDSYDYSFGTLLAEDGSVVLPTEKPTSNILRYVRFAGWSADPNAQEADYAAGDTVTDITESIELFAVWSNVFTLSFDLNGGSGNFPETELTSTEDGYPLLDLGELGRPVKDGIEFLGWDTDPAAVTIVYEFYYDVEVTDNMTLYAVWQQQFTDKEVLHAAIIAAKAKRTDDYTADSLAALNEAIAAAEAVKSSALATQDEVDAAITALNAAIAALVEKTTTVDKTALNEAIEAAEEKLEGDYTADSLAALEDAITAAETVANNAEATQAEVDAAVAALNAAVTALVENTATVDKTALNAAITAAKAKLTGDYTAESLAALNTAITAAEAAANKADATQAEVDAAVAALEAAVAALVENTATVDKTALNAAITAAKAKLTGDYTAESLAALNTAITAAETVANNADATQAEVNAAITALNAAVTALVNKPAATDKTAINNAIAAAEAQLKSQDYHADVKKALESALTAAKAKLSDSSATQAQLDSAAKALNDATNSLKGKSFFKLWGKPTKYEKSILNWILCIVLFGWIWMVF